MFGLILNVVATLMHGYLTWRVDSLSYFNTARRRRRLWLLSLIILLLYLAGIHFGHDASGTVAQWQACSIVSLWTGWECCLLPPR